MSDTSLDQSEEILSYEISDEALESAAGPSKRPTTLSFIVPL